MYVRGTTIKRLILCAAVMAAVSFPAFAGADEGGLGSVNLRTVYQSSTRIRAAIESIQKLEADTKATLEGVASDVKAVEGKLKEGEKTLKKDEKEKLQAELKSKQEKLKDERQAARVKLAFKQKAVENELRVRVQQAIDKAAEEAKLKGVISDAVLLYSKGIPDITGSVIKALDSGSSSTEKKAEPAKPQKQGK
jgi:Skp family chaperone for outer membrane proteins